MRAFHARIQQIADGCYSRKQFAHDTVLANLIAFSFVAKGHQIIDEIKYDLLVLLPRSFEHSDTVNMIRIFRKSTHCKINSRPAVAIGKFDGRAIRWSIERLPEENSFATFWKSNWAHTLVKPGD